LQEGLVRRAGDFGRATDEALWARSSRASLFAAALVHWIVLLAVVGGLSAGLVLVGVAWIQPKREEYAQGRAARAADLGEAKSRRDCLVLREAGTRADPKAVMTAIRLPPQTLAAPGGQMGDGEVLFAEGASPASRAAAGPAWVPSVTMGQPASRGKVVQAAHAGTVAALGPRG
jgi:hypothetical protein